MADDRTLDERVMDVKAATGYEADRPVEEYQGWKYGTRVVCTETNDEEMGPWDGEEGYVVISEVGSLEHDNVHDSLGMVVDGTEGPVDVDPSSINQIEDF